MPCAVIHSYIAFSQPRRAALLSSPGRISARFGGGVEGRPSLGGRATGGMTAETDGDGGSAVERGGAFGDGQLGADWPGRGWSLTKRR